MNVADIFSDLAALPRWVPYRLVFNPEREKFDKIPHNGRHGLSTSAIDHWRPLLDAVQTAKDMALSGVGFVMTGGIEDAGWRLVGFDFDDVDFNRFTPPFKSYAEVSPSGKGVRSFAWVPAEWAKNFKDTLDVHLKGCHHAEIYLGTSPRFLTVTFDAYNPLFIARLTGKPLLMMEEWLKPAERPEPLKLPEKVGTMLNMTDFPLTENQRQLISGTGKLDRSKELHGLVIKLIDCGAPLEDVMFTVTQVPALWQYFLDHRHEIPSRAIQFAQEEVARAFQKSLTYRRQQLVGFSKAWGVVDKKLNDAKKAAVEYQPFPMSLFEKGTGLVNEVARWVLRASFAPREEYAYACALSMVSCMIGPYCTHGTRGGKLNLYLALVGGTGSGKNEALDTMGLLMAATESKDCILDFPASEAALRRQLNLTPNILLRVDELAHKLESMESSSNGSSLGRAVLEAYNGARMPPKVYADERKTLPAVENPFVQILGLTTDKVWDVVKTTHMEDGTLNRFMFVCLPEDLEYRRNAEPDATIDKAFKDRLNAFWRDGKRYDLLGTDAGAGRRVSYAPGVLDAADALDKKTWGFQQGEYGGLYSRILQNTLKISGVLAVGAGRQEITLDDFNQAKTFVEWCVSNTHAKIAVRMADSHFERNMKRLLARLEQKEGKMTMREAYKFMHISRREMEELTATMALSGEIEIVPSEGGSVTEFIQLVGKDGAQEPEPQEA